MAWTNIGRFVRLDRLQEKDLMELHAVVEAAYEMKVPLLKFRAQLAGADEHRVVRAKRSGELLGFITLYRVNYPGQTLYVAACKRPSASSVMFAEAFALYFDELFDNGARKVYIEASETSAAQFIDGLQKVLGDGLVEEGRFKHHVPRGDGTYEDFITWALYPDVWFMSKVSHGKYNRLRETTNA